jgi:UDP-N-acetylmuramoyl-L-alanyl-D-glutamate--2,6-diaminopimelate ligase
VAAVTNVTHEHLDWHGSWENYLAAKARLFQSLETSARKPGVSKTAVLNLDDQSYPTLATYWAERTVTYTLGQQAATCHARNIRVGRDGTRFTLITPGGEIPIHLRLYGRYNVANALAAAGAGLSLGASLPAIAKGLNAVKRIQGRMEWVYSGAFDVVVDFAHTPHALEETIQLARDLRGKVGRVVLVFGSGGLRDVEKRAMMGRIACAADFSVITAEDPRTEDVNDIIEEIANGFAIGGGVEGVNFIRVPDRAEAISTAIHLARAGDIVVTCGKAHEKSMCYGTTETPWNEFAQIRKALRKRGL